MRYVTLPNTDLEVSEVGFGAWAVGGKWWGDDVRDEDSVAAVRRALELGVTLFDTAPLYGHGHADEVLRRALGKRLSEVTVATKVGVRWDSSGEHAQSDLSPTFVREDCEASLRRLGVETLDLLQVHWPCEQDTPLTETLETLRALKREGKIRHFGLCNYGAEELTRALEAGDLGAFQTPYSMIRREFDEALAGVVLPADAETARVGVFAYETLARGLLSGKFRSLPRFPKSDLRARDPRFWGTRFFRTSRWVDLLRQASVRVGEPPTALAAGWALSRPAISVVLVGAKRPAQVEQNVRASDAAARPEIIHLLDRVAAAYRG
ncbi:MAG: aldo/keto reductase [Deltaproteobacteria bacterium]|nr:aldo/keto reductase [Deltaproteobacteria bacterium]